MLYIASAVQGGGKSYKTLKDMLYQAYMAKVRRGGLLFDTNDEFGEYEIDGVKHRIQTIGHTDADIIRYGQNKNPEVRRIVPKYPNGMPMSPAETEKLIIRCLELYRGGTLLIEDTNRIFGDALPDALAGALVNVRHRNCDVILHVQSIARLVPKVRQNAKVIRFHKQLDPVESSSDKYKSEIEILLIAEKLVDKQYDAGNIRYYVYIWRETKKIKGVFSPKMFADAIRDYISENERVYNRYKRKVDLNTGKKLYTPAQAMEVCMQDLFLRYYGNPLPGVNKVA